MFRYVATLLYAYSAVALGASLDLSKVNGSIDVGSGRSVWQVQRPVPSGLAKTDISSGWNGTLGLPNGRHAAHDTQQRESRRAARGAGSVRVAGAGRQVDRERSQPS